MEQKTPYEFWICTLLAFWIGLALGFAFAFVYSRASLEDMFGKHDKNCRARLEAALRQQTMDIRGSYMRSRIGTEDRPERNL